MIFSSIIEIIKDIVGGFKKVTRNAEKDQELEREKLTSFDYYIGRAFMIILILLIADNLFNLSVSEWFYGIYEKILNYMIGVN